MPLARRRPPIRWLITLLLLLVLAEGATRLVEWVADRDYSAPDSVTSDRMLYQPHPFIGYVVQPGYSTPAGAKHAVNTNSLGFRGAEVQRTKPEGTFRIVCLGGSTTWGTGATADDRTWSAGLERVLNQALPPESPYSRVEVINAGVSGYTSLESFVNLKMRLLPLEPDLVIVYHAANDARALRRGQFETDHSHVRRSWSEPPETFLDDWLWWSHFYGVFRDWKADAAARTLAGRLYVKHYNSLPKRNADDIAPGLENFDWTLREIVALSRLHGAEVMLSTFTWRGGEEPTERAQDWKKDFAPILERMNAVATMVANQEGTLLADVRRRGPKDDSDFHDVVHFTDSGHGRVAAVMAGTITRSGLLLRPPRSGAKQEPRAKPGPGAKPGGSPAVPKASGEDPDGDG